MMQHPLVQKFYNRDFGLLLIRIGIGAAFISHGWMKLEDLHGIVGFFGTLGLPAFLAYFIAALEFVGGIAILIGVYVSIFGALLAIDMFFAIILVAGKMAHTRGFSAMELEFVLLTVSLGLSFIGAGRHAIIDCKR
jgi:putative oxidoreductase